MSLSIFVIDHQLNLAVRYKNYLIAFLASDNDLLPLFEKLFFHVVVDFACKTWNFHKILEVVNVTQDLELELLPWVFVLVDSASHLVHDLRVATAQILEDSFVQSSHCAVIRTLDGGGSHFSYQNRYLSEVLSLVYLVDVLAILKVVLNPNFAIPLGNEVKRLPNLPLDDDCVLREVKMGGKVVDNKVDKILAFIKDRVRGD